MEDEANSKRSWLLTLPGLLTSVAAIISAITGLLAAMHFHPEVFPGGHTDFRPSPTTLQVRPPPSASHPEPERGRAGTHR